MTEFEDLHAKLVANLRLGMSVFLTGDVKSAQMLLADGTRSPEWPAVGLTVCTVAGEQQDPVLGPNAVGGGFVVWRDGRDFASNGWDLYAQTVTSDGRLDAATGTPLGFALSAARPNPAWREVRFRLRLPAAHAVRFDVLDVAGRLLHRERLDLPAGDHDLSWALNGRSGERVRPGLYLATVRAGAFAGTQRVVVTD
jgi:hypothetical protein